MIGRNWTFKLTDEQYDKYEKWCKENHLDGYHGACGGSTSFRITPTSIGHIVEAFAIVYAKDELGNISYDENGKARQKEIVCDLTDEGDFG